MDLGLYIRVLRRFRVLVGIGIVLATILALSSYYKISFENGKPTLTNRKAEVWQAPSTIFLASEQPARTYTQPGRFIGLAPLYAQLGNGDPVRNATARRCGRLRGSFTVVPVADTTYSVVNGLPMVSVIGTAATPLTAAKMSACATTSFLAYMEDQQISSGVPARDRVRMTVIKVASDASLVVPRKKTLPIVIFMAVLFATIALAFILENARPRVRVLPAAEDPEEIRRTA